MTDSVSKAAIVQKSIFCFLALEHVFRRFLGFLCHPHYTILGSRIIRWVRLTTIFQTAATRRPLRNGCFYFGKRGRCFRPGPRLLQIGYFSVTEIYNFGLLCRVTVSLGTCAFLLRSIFQGIFAQNTLIGGRAHRWFEMSLNLQQDTVLSYFTPRLPLPWLVFRVVVESTHGAFERPNRV